MKAFSGGRFACRAALWITVLATAFSSVPAWAAIYLSGDGNLLDALTGIPNSVNVDPGNQQFFRNVLGGGTRVAVLQNTYPGCCESFDEQISQFYNGEPGVTAATIVGTVDAASLNGVDLFLSAVPDDAFTASEFNAMQGLLNSGGSIFFLGENSLFGPYNDRINDAMIALGSPLRIVGDGIDPGYHTVGSNRIAADPTTVGVNTFTYAFTSQVPAVAGGKTLFSTLAGQPFLAVSRIPEPGTGILAAVTLLCGMLVGRQRRP